MSRPSLASALLLGLLLGCGSKEPETTATPDASTDAADAAADTKPDTNTTPDTNETGGISCAQDLGNGFTCKDPKKATGAKTCTEAMLQELASKCITADVKVPTACNEWKAAYAACATCVADWSWSTAEGGPAGNIYPDDWKCYWATMDAPCAKSVSCTYACEEEVCGECDREPGSGTGGKSEYRNCIDKASSAGGRCWDVAAKDFDGCFEKFDVKHCDVSEMYEESPDLATLKQQIVRYLRGACRDGGDWKNAESPGGDAGTDGGAETGVDAAVDAAVDVGVSG